MSSSGNGNQQSIEMRNRGAINKTAGTLMSFGAVHDKYTKGIDITQVSIRHKCIGNGGYFNKLYMFIDDYY